MNYTKLVQELNESLYLKYNDDSSPFTYNTNGYSHIIKYCDIILWFSEQDERKFNEEENDYEPLDLYVINKFNEYISSIKPYEL